MKLLTAALLMGMVMVTHSEDIPPPQILREMQPDAKFIITMSDPVKRTYSDYHFLGDDLKPVMQGPPPGNRGRKKDNHHFESSTPSTKSAQEFHDRTTNIYQVCLT